MNGAFAFEGVWRGWAMQVGKRCGGNGSSGGREERVEHLLSRAMGVGSCISLYAACICTITYRTGGNAGSGG